MACYRCGTPLHPPAESWFDPEDDQHRTVSDLVKVLDLTGGYRHFEVEAVSCVSGKEGHARLEKLLEPREELYVAVNHVEVRIHKRKARTMNWRTVGALQSFWCW